MAELAGGRIIRDEVLASLGPSLDRLGRKAPKPLGALGIITVGISCGGPAPTEIPSDYWSQDLNDEGYTAATVACPCGESPCVEIGCLHGCTCERYFYFALDKVLVFNSPARPAVASTAELQSES